MNNKFFLSFIFGFILFSSQLLLATGDPSISLSPANGTTFEGGINGNGKTVQISYNVGDLESTWWQGDYKGFEVWLYIDGNEVAYHRDTEKHPVDINFTGLTYSNSLNYYLSQGSHSIKVKAKNFERVLDLWLDVDEASKTNTVQITPPPVITVDNNFTDQSGAAHGVVVVSGFGTRTAPFSFEKNSGQSLSLTAVSPQTDNGGYQVIWNSNGTNNSIWDRNSEYLGGDQSYSFTVQAADDGAIFKAQLRKVCSVTVRNQISGTSFEGTVKINGQTYNSGQVETVIEENTINVEAEAYYIINGIKYNFNSWSDQNLPRNSTFNISEHRELIAKYRGFPIFNDNPADGNYRNQRFNAYNPRVDQNITVYWDEHPNSDVTNYQIYRKVLTYQMIPVSEGLVATVPRGTTSWTDNGYLIGAGQDIDYNIRYSVCAYYSVNETTSEIIYQQVSANNLPGVDKQQAEEDISEEQIIVENYSIGNYPNPFNPATTINYQLPEKGHVTIKVYDTLGKEVAELVNEVKDKGIYNVWFDGSNTANGVTLASGIYIYTLQIKGLKENSTGFITSKKMLLMK